MNPKITNKNQANKQNRNRIIGVEIIWRVISWEEEMVQGSRSITGRNKIDREYVKNSIGKG